MEEKKSKLKIVIIIFLVLIILMVIGIFAWYKISMQPVSNKNNEIVVEIVEKSGTAKIAETLKKNNLIKDELVFKIYCKLNNVNNLKAGKYKLSENMSMEQIIKELQNGNIISEDIDITFIEGKNMRWIAQKIADNTNNSYEDVFNLLKNEEYIDKLIDKYWFLTDDIKDENIYYPLEGYLFPDTYTFENKDVSIETIFDTMLQRMDKTLSEYKIEIDSNDYSIHELLSLASVVELEGLSASDRAKIAGVFYNRLDKKMSLQSDVTTYYAWQIDMSEGDLTKKQLNSYNPYNTRGTNMGGKLPIGPICSPSESSIIAVLKPEESDNLFFIADKNGKVYFSKTNSEHEKIKQELINNNLWNTYE